jgi:excinuclease ABC subunit C
MPLNPGVYLFKGPGGEVLYVGKAGSLRKRVRSYFNPTGKSIRTQTMTSRATDLDWIVTDSEVEALILESELVKQYRPRYNVRLRDDKQFPYLCVTVQEPFPRVFRVRRTRKDGARYFGPYVSSVSLNETIGLLKKLFPYRTCDLVIPDETASPEPVLHRPCLEFFIDRCTAPCVRNVTREEYGKSIEQMLLFLEGRHETVLSYLRDRMRKYADELNFEGAAQVRDRIQAVERSIERQKISNVAMGDSDVIGVAVEQRDASAQVFQIRNGKVIDRRQFMLENFGEDDDVGVLQAFVPQFYERATRIPKQVLLPFPLPDGDAVEALLTRMAGTTVKLSAPQRGEKRKLVELVTANARDALEQSRIRWLTDKEKTSIALAELEAELHLPARPHRIECFDISTIQGTSTVAAMVVFEDGQPKNSDYRRFKVTSPDGPDDFAAMYEVLKRRFRRAVSNPEDTKDGWHVLPDLVIIDGGKGQLHAAMDALRELGCAQTAVVSLAKRLEEIFVPDRSESAVLPRESQGLYLLQRIRDEAHRFAITYHRQLRGTRTQRSILDGFRGVGPARRRALIKAFGSVQGLREATVEEISGISGITPSMATALKEYLSET